MEGKIICYNLKSSNLSQGDIIHFLQEFAGYDNKSNYGKYTYHRPGILDKILHIKPVRSVIIVSASKSPQIIYLMEKYKINIRGLIISKQSKNDMTKIGR